jgi:ribonuclease E
MVENRSNRAVERKLKDCLKNDRARIQVGRISHFGLMEMSRQRIRFGVVESSTHKCPTCSGTGLVRSVESLALMVMRNVEDHVMKKPGQSINLRVPTDVALYILNSKRGTLNTLEAKYGLSITIVADDHVGPSHFAIERGEARQLDRSETAGTHVRVDTATLPEAADADAADLDVLDEEEEDAEETAARSDEGNGERTGRRRRRRRGRERGERPENGVQRQQAPVAATGDEEGSEEDGESDAPVGADGAPREDGEPRRRRRRGRRGGRRNRRPEDGVEQVAAEAATGADAPAEEAVAEFVAEADVVAAETTAGVETVVGEESPKPKRGRRKKPEPVAEEAAVVAEPPTVAEAPAAEAAAEEAPKPKRSRARKPKAEPVAEDGATDRRACGSARVRSSGRIRPSAGTASH